VISGLEGENQTNSSLERFFHRYSSLLSIHDGLSVLKIKWWLRIAWVMCFLEFSTECQYCVMGSL
jgi:hypothetical protein